jgi:hypothetical protein
LTGSEYYNAYPIASVANHTITLNSVAEADILAEINGGDGIFSIGAKPDPATQHATLLESTNFDSDDGANPPQISITYTIYPPPDAVTDLASVAFDTDSVNLTWSAPNLNGGTLVNYLVNKTTPWGDPVTFVSNATDTAYNVTGLASATEHSFRVSALTQKGYNATGNIYNITTVATPPTTLIVNPQGTSTSQLNLEWIAPVPNTKVNGYKIEREAPVGGGFSTIVANTTNTNLYYNNTGLVINTYYNYRVSALTPTNSSDPSNTYSQTTYHLPDAVTNLNATNDGFGSSLLEWAVPSTLYGYLQGYMINYTTPFGTPETIYIDDTESSSTSQIVGLPVDDYSFRVSAVTIHGTNVTGAAIANVTTVQDTTIGSIDADFSEQADVATVPIAFSLVTIDNSTSDLQVFYDSAYDLNCNFSYKYSRVNQTYSGLVENTISGSDVYTNFTINDPQNEIIDVLCWDVLDTDTDGRYQIAEGTTPLFEQVSNFQGGIYGTNGMFGIFDLITLLVVIVSMIGFNRYNPAVGAVLLVMMLGVLTFYGVIELAGSIFGALALLIVLAIGTVRKN